MSSYNSRHSKKTNAQKVIHTIKKTAAKAKDATVEKVQEIDIVAIINEAMNLPGAKIDRSRYLRKQLSKYYPNRVVEEAIRTTPAKAGVSKEVIETLADASINYENLKVTTVASAMGIPGGLALFGTIPADAVQYFLFAFRIAQKLAYLYGCADLEDIDPFDDSAMSIMWLFIGSMFGVKEAAAGIKVLAETLQKAVEKKLARKALMNGAIYPIVKSVAKKLEIEMTKEIFAKGVGKTVPIAGALVSGFITFGSFKVNCHRLQKDLEQNFLSDIVYKDWD